MCNIYSRKKTFIPQQNLHSRMRKQMGNTELRNSNLHTFKNHKLSFEPKCHIQDGLALAEDMRTGSCGWLSRVPMRCMLMTIVSCEPVLAVHVRAWRALEHQAKQSQRFGCQHISSNMPALGLLQL